DIARRTADESAKDAGALPLLSYLLDDMWKHMVERGDGVLRLPATAVELGGVLAERADRFLSLHPQAEEELRRLLTLKLATVRECLAWKSGVEAARRAWQAAPDKSKNDALLMGFALIQASRWFAGRAADIAQADRDFVAQSRKAMTRRRLRVQTLVGVLVA